MIPDSDKGWWFVLHIPPLPVGAGGTGSEGTFKCRFFSPHAWFVGIPLPPPLGAGGKGGEDGKRNAKGYGAISST